MTALDPEIGETRALLFEPALALSAQPVSA